MGCIRNLSRIWARWAILIAVALCPVEAHKAEADFASKFSLTVGELYTDNIFFSNTNKDHDFVTTIVPTLSLYYAPAGEAAPTLNLNISPSGAIFARHSQLNNFGDGGSLSGGYTYRYSPRLEFHVSDVASRQGAYQLGPLASGVFNVPNPPTSPPPPGGTLPGQGNQPLSSFFLAGSTISNNLSFQGTYQYKEGTSLTASYSNTFDKFLDAGGTDLYQNFAFLGTYNWGRGHNLFASYSISYYNPRSGRSSVFHNFNFGDSYFSSNVIPLTPTASLTTVQGVSGGTGGTAGSGANVLNVQLTPTLNLAASTGLSINPSGNGPPVTNNTNITITKLWERATLAGAFDHGLTPSYGVSGLSTTTSLSSWFNMQLTERISTLANVYYSFYNTNDGNFSTFSVSAGVQYPLTPWLSSTLFYNYRWADTSSQAARTSDNLLQKGLVRANSVYLTLTTYFDVWPNVGLASSLTAPSLTPILRTPFPMAAPVAAPSKP